MIALAIPIFCVGWLIYAALADNAAEDLLRPRNPAEPDTSVPDEVDRHLRVERPDGIEIDVWLMETDVAKPSGAVDTLLVLHGISDQKRTMLSLGRRFNRHGVRAVLVDLRGHGTSSRTGVTFGVREREDLVAVLDAVEEVSELGELGVYGPSYGGAVAIQLAGVEPRVRRVVTVAAFCSMQEIVGPLVTSSWGWFGTIVPDFLTEAMVESAGKQGGFDPNQASPEDLVGASQARFLIVHSRDDDIVPYAHGQAIAERCGERCELVTLEGKDHLGSLSNVELRSALHEFMVGEEWTGG